jgi:hypothetical protein
MMTTDPAISKQLIADQKIKVTVESLPDDSGAKTKKELDPATRRFLDLLENAPNLGLIGGTFSREEIHGERIDERY